jgi:hypothetical protein
MLGELTGETAAFHTLSPDVASYDVSAVLCRAPCCAACTTRPPSIASPPTSGAVKKRTSAS